MRHPINIPKPVNDRYTVITGIVIATLCNKPSKAAAILNTIEFDSNQICIADINSDSSIDVLDVVMVVEQILNFALQNSDSAINKKHSFKNNLINR